LAEPACDAGEPPLLRLGLRAHACRRAALPDSA
jgi:hypothetical protein